MNILILGSGGREHAFAWKISQSAQCDKLYVAPGNAGTSQVGVNVQIEPTDFAALGEFCLKSSINLILVGPEAPLVAGIVDYFKSTESLSHIIVIGPDRKGAQLEGSKDFSKSFMNKYGVPTAASKTFTLDTLADGLEYLNTQQLPIVLKADGLAAGKGVIIAETLEEAKSTLREMLADKKFGQASSKVVIEEYLSGIELSVFVLTDGKDYVILPEAKDYKRIGEKDTGLNTGGMGAVSPVSFADKTFLDKVEKTIIIPTINGLKKEDIHYRGFIFIGIMNVSGEPYVIEYNARMGDPETEVVIPRIKNDFLDLLIKTGKSELRGNTIDISSETATTVMLVAGGYPGDYKKGDVISGLSSFKDVLAFHAGTLTKGGDVVTNGGRVIALTGFGKSIEEAIGKSNAAAESITWNGRYYRRDIGLDLLELAK